MNTLISLKTRRRIAAALTGMMLFTPFAQAQTVTYQYQKYMIGLPSEVPSGNASPSIVDFGEVQIPGASPWYTVTFANTGNTDLNVGEVRAPAGFELQNGCGAVLTSKQSCDLKVRFVPAVSGVTRGTMSVESTAYNSPDLVAFTGVGTLPVASFSANPLNLGNVEVGHLSTTTTLGITNTGTGVLNVSNLNFSGFEQGFSVTEGSCGPLPKSLGHQQGCELEVSVLPSAKGALSGAVNVVTNDATGGYAIPLLANGIQAGLVLSSAALNFGDVPTDIESEAQFVTVTNNGTAPLNIVSVTRLGASSDQFLTDNPCGTPVSPGDACTISVAAKLTSGGVKTADLEIISNAPNSPVLVGLSATGTLPGIVTTNTNGVAVSSAAFGNVPVDETTQASPTKTIVVKNPSESELQDLVVAFGGTNADQFSFSTTCGNSVLAGGSCNISLTANPSSAGAKSAAVTITAKAANSPKTLPVTATASVPTAVVSPTALTIPAVKVGFASSSTVTVSNSGAAPLAIASVSLSGAQAAEFTQTNNCPAQLAANGGTCTVTVTGTPSAAGLRSTTLVVSTNDASSPANVPVSITGVEPELAFQNSAGSVLPQANVGNIHVGTTKTAAVYLKNTSAVALNVYTVQIEGTNAAEFQQTNTCTSAVGPGNTCVVTVASTPANVGGNAATLKVTSDAPAYTHTLPLVSNGIQATLEYHVATLPFGDVLVGSSSTAQTVLLRNTGTDTATGLTVALSGTHANDFTISSKTCGTTLAAGALCEVALKANPLTTGAQTAYLVATSNATNPSESLPVTVTGTQPNIVLRNTANTANVTSLAFNSQLVGTTSGIQQYRVYNKGTAPASNLSVTEAGTNSDQFGMTSNCGTGLGAGSFCTVTVSYSPKVKSTSHTSSVRVSSSAPNSPHTVALSGSSIQGTVRVTVDGLTNPTSISFGTVVVN